MPITPLSCWLIRVSTATEVFAGLAVADNQFALTAADGDQRIDCLDAGFQRLGDRRGGR